MALPVTTSPQDPSPVVCAGRFVAELPAGWQVKFSSQALYRVEIAAVKLKGLDERQVWAAKLRQLREMRRPPGADDVVVREFNLGKDTPAVWYHASAEFASSVSLYAQRRFGDHLVTTTRNSEKGSEAPAQELVQLVLDAYRPGQVTGFCIGPGGFVSTPGGNERAEVKLVMASNPALEAKIETSSQREPNPTHPLDAPSVQSLAPAAQFSPTVDQAVGPFMGKTKSIEVKDKQGGSELEVMWYYPGQAGDPLAPMIKLSVSGGSQHRDALRSAFTQLMKTMRPIPR